MPSNLLSISQVAEELGLTVHGVRWRIHAGQLPFIKLGPYYYIDRDELAKQPPSRFHNEREAA